MHNATKGIKKKKNIPGTFAKGAPEMCLVEAAVSTAAFPYKAIPRVQTHPEPSYKHQSRQIWGLTSNPCLLKATALGSHSCTDPTLNNMNVVY